MKREGRERTEEERGRGRKVGRIERGRGWREEMEGKRGGKEKGEGKGEGKGKKRQRVMIL